MIDIVYVQEQVEVKKREEILKRHQYAIWLSDNVILFTKSKRAENLEKSMFSTL